MYITLLSNLNESNLSDFIHNLLLCFPNRSWLLPQILWGLPPPHSPPKTHKRWDILVIWCQKLGKLRISPSQGEEFGYLGIFPLPRLFPTFQSIDPYCPNVFFGGEWGEPTPPIKLALANIAKAQAWNRMYPLKKMGDQYFFFGLS